MMKVMRWIKTLPERVRCPKCSHKQKVPWYRPIKQYRRFNKAVHGSWTRWQIIRHLATCHFEGMWFHKYYWQGCQVKYLEHVLGLHAEPPHDR